MRVFKNVRKIAILRANSLGDFIFTLPAIKAIRNRYPTAEITLLGKKWHEDFLVKRESDVDRVEVVPPYPGVGEPEDYIPDERELARFFARMRKERFDLAFQLHGGGRNSNPFLIKLGARLTFGLRTPDAQPLDFNLPYVYFQHEVLRYLEVAGLAGARGIEVLPSLRPAASDLAAASQYMPTDRSKRLVILHPGATDLRRRWPVEKFAEIAHQLYASGAEIRITGNHEEQHLTSRLSSLIRVPHSNLTGLLDLGGLTGLLYQADLLVSNDTGPLHLAMALGVPSVGIYWCGNMINASPLHRLSARPAISWMVVCPICGKHIIYDRDKSNCQHEISFVSDVTVDEVLGSAMELLKLERVKSRWLNS